MAPSCFEAKATCLYGSTIRVGAVEVTPPGRESAEFVRVSMQIVSQIWADKMRDSDQLLQEKARGLDMQLQLSAQEQDAFLTARMFEFFNKYEDSVVQNIATYRKKAW